MNDDEFSTAGIGGNADVSKGDGMESRNENARNKHQQGSPRSEKSRDLTEASRTKSTGPRTVLGKRTSSRNAIKHGFFSRVFLLKNESRTEYQFLISALREAFQPVGALEDLAIEDVAMCWMRKKRHLKAERAEIALATEFIEVDLVTEQHKQLYEVQESGFQRTGQLRACSNPAVLSECILLLESIRDDIYNDTLDSKTDSKTLEFIYGLFWAVDPGVPFLIAFKYLKETVEAQRSKQGQEPSSDYERVRQMTITSLGVEIERLRTMKKGYLVIQKHRLKYLKQAALVPSSETLERLLRYSAYWNREFERKLSLLEHLQRMRRGLPVPPAVRVELSP